MTIRKTDKLLYKMKSICVVITMLLGVSFVSAISVSAKNISLSSIIVPKSGSKTSNSFQVNDRGSFSVQIKLSTNTFFGTGGESRYRAELMFGNTVLVTRERTVGGVTESLSLPYSVSNCNRTGMYRVKVTNVSRTNPLEGKASFSRFDVPALTPKSGDLSAFNVRRNGIRNRSILNHLQPSGSGGRIKITAMWNGSCLPDVKGCKLRFRLRRNDSNMSSDSGYSHNSIFAGSSEKMTISYLVPANQVTGNWKLQIVGDSRADVNNVKTKVAFTPQCQN